MFYACTSLKDVDLPNKLVKIGYKVFSNTPIESITIPKSLEVASSGITDLSYWGPFGGCNELKTVKFEEGRTTLLGNLFEGCNGLEEVIIPNTITQIGSYAFRYCKKLKSVMIPDSVTVIGNDVFYGCTSLREIDLPNSITSMGEAVNFSVSLKGKSFLI